MKKKILISALSFAAMALVSCKTASSNILAEAKAGSANESTTTTDDGSGGGSSSASAPTSKNGDLLYCTITVDLNGGHIADESKLHFDVRVGTVWRYAVTWAPRDLTRENRVFSYYSLVPEGKEYVDGECVNERYSIPETHVFYTDTTIYAQYQFDSEHSDDPCCRVYYMNVPDETTGEIGEINHEDYLKEELPLYHGSTPIYPGEEEVQLHRFDGWDPYEPATHAINDEDISKGKLEFTAQYSLIVAKRKVTYHLNFDDKKHEERVDDRTYAPYYHPSAQDTKPGHHLVNWFIDDVTFQLPFDFEHTKITADLDLYAKWEKNTYTVTLNANGGKFSKDRSEIQIPDILYDTPIPSDKVETPSKLGYTFTNWSTDAAGTNLFDINTPIQKEMTIYAQYNVNTIPIRFYPGEVPDVPGRVVTQPRWADGQSFQTADTEFGKTPIAPSSDPSTLILPVCDGVIYSFAGWKNSVTGTIGLIPVSTDINNPESYTAQWNITADSRVVIFELEDHTEYTRQVVVYGDKAIKPEDPTSPYGEFQYWYINSDPNQEYNFDTPVTKNITLTALFKEARYVTFDCGDRGRWQHSGGRTVQSKTVVGDYPAPTDSLEPTDTGYRFAGWSPTIVPVEPESQHPSDYTYTAQWEVIPEHVTITFDTQGGSNVPARTIKKGDVVGTPPADPHKTGYDFDGWYDRAEMSILANEWHFYDWEVNEDTTIYAHWDDTFHWHTVYFHLTDSVIYDFSKDVQDGNRIDVPDVPVREGYKFNGWFLDFLVWTEPFDLNHVYEPSDGAYIHVYASWTADPVPPTYYTVTFDPNGGTPTPEAKKVESGHTVSSPGTVTRTGYKLVSWTDQSGHAWDFGSDTVSGNTTLTAQWILDVDQKHVITINPNNGTGTPYTVDVYNGQTLKTPATPTYDDKHMFLGWFKDATNLFEFDHIFTNEDPVNMTLTAHWEDVTVYHTVTYDANGGSPTPPIQQIEDGNVIPNAPADAPTKEGYKFNGWWTAPTGGEQWTFGTGGKQVTANMTLFAQWLRDPDQAHTITFDENYEGGQKTNATVYNGDKLVAPMVPVRTGFAFLGWYDKDVEEGSTQFDFDKVFHNTDSKTMTLYAHWSEIPSPAKTCTVTFKDDEGSTIGTQIVSMGTGEGERLVTRPVDPQKQGKTFVGWYDAQTGGSLFSFGTKLAEGTETLSIYAHFDDVVEYTVKFYINDGSGTSVEKTVEAGGTVSPIPTPSYEGHTFLGWFTTQEVQESEIAFDFATPITADTNLYAHWSEQPAPTGSTFWFYSVNDTDTLKIGSESADPITVGQMGSFEAGVYDFYLYSSSGATGHPDLSQLYIFVNQVLCVEYNYDASTGHLVIPNTVGEIYEISIALRQSTEPTTTQIALYADSKSTWVETLIPHFSDGSTGDPITRFEWKDISVSPAKWIDGLTITYDGSHVPPVTSIAMIIDGIIVEDVSSFYEDGYFDLSWIKRPVTNLAVIVYAY